MVTSGLRGQTLQLRKWNEIPVDILCGVSGESWRPLIVVEDSVACSWIERALGSGKVYVRLVRLGVRAVALAIGADVLQDFFGLSENLTLSNVWSEYKIKCPLTSRCCSWSVSELVFPRF